MKNVIIFLFLFLSINSFATDSEKNTQIFDKIMKAADENNWQSLPINEVIIKVAEHFLNTPYVGGTLEGTPEMCRYTFTGLDCVTFYENSLTLARMIKKGENSLEEFEKELTFIRYRNGILTDYSSRLHYTSDYFQNNVEKGVWEDITKEIGGIKLEKKINFMSTHPQYYDALKNDTAMINKIAAIENNINKNEIYYIPKEKVSSIEKQLRAGDIIGITSSVEGLDYNHTGLAYRDEKGLLRFFHASSTEKKVIIDERLSDYLKKVRKHTGISVMRAK